MFRCLSLREYPAASYFFGKNRHFFKRVSKLERASPEKSYWLSPSMVSIAMQFAYLYIILHFEGLCQNELTRFFAGAEI
jgi:hypothetical protein